MKHNTEPHSSRIRQRSLLLAACLFVGVGTFAIAQGLRSDLPAPPTSLASQEALLEWLDVGEAQRQQIQQADPGFETEARRLIGQLKADRGALAKRLRDPASSNATLREHLDRAMATEAALEHLVADHVLTIRPILNPEQQQMLLGLVAEGLEKNAGDHLR